MVLKKPVIRKKAVMSFVAWMVVLVISAVVLFMIYNTAVLRLNSYKNREVCRLSVVNQAATKFSIIGKAIDSPLTLNCDTFVTTFHEKSIEIDGKKAEFLYKGAKKTNFGKLTLNDDIVNSFVAEELRLCWYQFMEGKKDILNDQTWDWGDNEKACFICDEFMFANDVSKEKFTGFYQYLKDNTIPNNEKMSYYDYLTNPDTICYFYGGPPNCFENYLDAKKFDPVANSASSPLSSPGKPFATTLAKIINIFEMNRHKPIERDINFTKRDVYVVFFVREGAEEKLTSFFSYVMPVKELNNQCSKFI